MSFTVSKRLVMLIFLFVVVGFLYHKSLQFSKAYEAQPHNVREPLHLPTDFDNSYQINKQLLKDVKDYTILDNDRRQWDRGFWPCLESVMKLSPEEINRRSHEIEFSEIDDDSDLDQHYRDQLRGTFIRIEGQYQPDNIKYIQLPDNPTGRQFLRLGIVGKPESDLFRINVPEAWLVYFLDDSNAKKNDTVQVEGVFFKLMKFTSKKNEQTYYLPVLVARSPTVLKSYTQEHKSSAITPNTIFTISIICIVTGSLILFFFGLKKWRQNKFKHDVLKKIKDKHQK